jgi:hypothetical protein
MTSNRLLNQQLKALKDHTITKTSDQSKPKSKKTKRSKKSKKAATARLLSKDEVAQANLAYYLKTKHTSSATQEIISKLVKPNNESKISGNR